MAAPGKYRGGLLIREGVIVMGIITEPGEDEEVIILEPVGRPEDAPVAEPSPELVPERETVPA
jgi:hypothetical protein